MSERRAVVVTLFVVTVAALVPVLAGGVPANQVPVHESDQGGSLAKPSGNAWTAVDPVTVELSSAPSSVPDAADTSIDAVSVRVARTHDRLYVRLSWPDATADRTVTGPRTFVDAVAVQFPVNASDHPGIAMGSTRSPVNVWYWRADQGGEELLAGGPATTTAYQAPAIESAAAHADGRWTVVFHRELVPEAANRTAFRMTTDVDLAFAVWNGSNLERSGRKAVSEWHHLPLGPPPQGPPYAAILWTIAGIAIVVVLVVTAYAVRRTGG